MFLVVWEFKIKPDCLEKFLRVYGPEGDWAQLFANDCNFQKTVLVQEAGIFRLNKNTLRLITTWTGSARA